MMELIIVGRSNWRWREPRAAANPRKYDAVSAVVSGGLSATAHLQRNAQATAAEWLAAGHLPIEGEALPLDDEREAQAWIKRITAIDADLVVIDLPPHSGAATAAALILADLFVVPVTPSGLDLRAAGR